MFALALQQRKPRKLLKLTTLTMVLFANIFRNLKDKDEQVVVFLLKTIWLYNYTALSSYVLSMCVCLLLRKEYLYIPHPYMLRMCKTQLQQSLRCLLEMLFIMTVPRRLCDPCAYRNSSISRSVLFLVKQTCTQLDICSCRLWLCMETAALL